MEMSRSSPLMSPYRVEAAQDTPTQTVNVPLGHIPNLQVLEEVKEVNTMKPLYTLVLCLPRCPGVDRVRVWGSSPVVPCGPARRSLHSWQTAE
jgi:hypothetical protein